MDKYTIAPPAGSTQNGVGASDRPWREGHFDSVKLNGGDVGTYLAESTGYGIVSGCEPSISGLTVTVGAGVVHLADGTRKEIASTNVTLDAADSTNPRIDLVYIDSTGTVAKITGTAAASPVVPSVPANGISVAQVSVAAGATTGILNQSAMWTNEQTIEVIFVEQIYANQGDCTIIKTPDKNIMIDTGLINDDFVNNIKKSLLKHNISHIDIILLTHYHNDHFGGLVGTSDDKSILSLPAFQNAKIILPSPNDRNNQYVIANYNNIVRVINYYGNTYEIADSDRVINVCANGTLKLMCCNDSLRTYLADKSTDENEYSIVSMFNYNNVCAVFPGDSEGYEIPYILDNYDLRHADIYKANHHGYRVMPANDNVSGHLVKYAQILSPTHVIYNGAKCYAELYGEEYVTVQERPLIDLFQLAGINILWNQDEMSFTTDGFFVKNTSVINRYFYNHLNTSEVNVFVDKNYAGQDSDGSYSKPYREVNAALERIGMSESGAYIKINIASAQYTRVDIRNLRNAYIMLSFAENCEISNEIVIENCFWIGIKGNVTVKKISIDKSNVEFLNKLTINSSTVPNTDKDKNTIKNSLVSIENLQYDGYGKNADASKWEVGLAIYRSNVNVRTLTLNDVNYSGIVANQGAYLMINTFTASNAKGCITLSGSQASAVIIKKYGTLTNVDKLIPYLSTDKAALLSLPDTINHYGNTANRPTNDRVQQGHLYYDTTLGHMLVWTGSKWHDCTTNADL